MADIRLLIEADGGKEWRTLSGHFVTGGCTILGGEFLHHGHMGDDLYSYSIIVESATRSYVLYKNLGLQPGEISIFKTVDELRASVPKNIWRRFAIAEGIESPDSYPEKPLEVE